MRRLIVGLCCLLVLLVGLLCASHARAESNPNVCFDELMIRWNEFASDANRHAQTVEVGTHDKTHAKLDREFAGLKALSCW